MHPFSILKTEQLLLNRERERDLTSLIRAARQGQQSLSSHDTMSAYLNKGLKDIAKKAISKERAGLIRAIDRIGSPERDQLQYIQSRNIHTLRAKTDMGRPL